MCWLMSRLESIDSWVRARKHFLPLVLLAGRFSSLLMRLVASKSPRPSRFMFRDATQGERRGGAVLVTGSAMAQVVGTVGGSRDGATPGTFGLVSTFIGAVYEGACVDIWSGVATLGGGMIKATLGVGDESQIGCRPTDDIISNFSGAGVGFDART